MAGAAGVYIDWDFDGFSTGAYDDVSSNVISWTISRGGAPEITGGSSPGTATVILKNPSDLYNPRYAAGALYGKLRDGLPIWIGVSEAGKLTGTPVRGLFAGRVTDITLIPAGGSSKSPTVELVCEDALGWYGRVPIRIGYAPLLAGLSQAEVRSAALSAAGEYLIDLAAEITTLPAPHATADLKSVLDQMNAANGTRHYIAPLDDYGGAAFDDWYAYTTRNRQWRLNATVDATLSASSQHVTGTSGWRLSADTVTNQSIAKITPILFTPDTVAAWSADELPIYLTDAAHWVRIVSFDNLVRVNPGSPAINIAYTGNTVNWSTTDFGTGMKIDLFMAPGETATVTHLSVDGAIVRELEAQSYVADDLTSQEQPRGIRASSEISGPFVGTFEAGIGIAKHVVWRYADPQLRPTVTVENWFPQMFQLDLFDVISLTSTHLGMTSRLFEIVGLTHEGRVASSSVQHHIVTYTLQESRAQTDPGWFVLDSSLIAGPKILAY